MLAGRIWMLSPVPINQMSMKEARFLNPLGLFQRALVVAVVTDLAVAACGGVILAVMVDLAAIIEFHLGVSR